jgi:hypothetical protein
MEDTVIRPTMKFIKLGYALVLLVIVAAVIGASMLPQDDAQYRPWAMGLPVLLLIWPIRRHIQRNFTKGTISGDKLRYEVGEGAGRAGRPIRNPAHVRHRQPFD